MAAHAQVDYTDPAVRVYAALLGLYPRDHRRAYGPLMAQLFRDQVREARAGDDRHELTLLYLRTLVDFVASVVREHGHAAGLGEPIGGWRYPRAAWWQALLAAVPGLLLIASDLQVFRVVFPWAPYPHPTLMAAMGAIGCLAIVALALWRERRLPDWALTSAGVLATHGPYALSLVWREGYGPLWSAMGVPALVLLVGAVVGLVTLFRQRLGSAALPRWAWIVAGLSVLSIVAAAVHEAHYTSPWRWETALAVLWRWAYFAALLGLPLLGAAALAPARGARAVLLVLPVAVWWSVGMVTEPAYFVAVGAGDRALEIVVDQLPVLVLLVAMPVVLLRVRVAAYQAVALLVASMGTLLALELLCARALPAYDGSAVLNVYRSGLALQLAVSLAFVVAIYDALARATQMDWLV